MLLGWVAMTGAQGCELRPVSACAMLFPLLYLRGSTAKAMQLPPLRPRMQQVDPFIYDDARLRPPGADTCPLAIFTCAQDRGLW